MIWNILNATTTKLVVVALISSATLQCSAASFGFEQITSNGTENPESQLSVDVSDSSGRVLFKFFNNNISGTFASRISEVYWDDSDNLLSNGPDIDALNTSSGVDLSDSPASPANLPSGVTVNFNSLFSAGRQMAASNGVDPGEFAGFLFDGDANTVISAIHSGSLRMGLHVISIGAGGNSEAFVNTPEPTSFTLICVGLLGLASCRKQRATSRSS